MFNKIKLISQCLYDKKTQFSLLMELIDLLHVAEDDLVSALDSGRHEVVRVLHLVQVTLKQAGSFVRTHLVQVTLKQADG